jgi:acetyl esterase/lipase
MKSLLVFLTFIIFVIALKAQPAEPMNLYQSAIPGQKISDMKERFILVNGTRRIYSVIEPTLTKFEPANPNGTAIIICPGGAYIRLSIDNEGEHVAKALNEKGITAFVLKYRLPNDSIMKDKTVGPLQDLQEAIRTVRKNATAWGLKENKIGVMGFSAGGHLASCATVHFKFKADRNNTDTINVRPDFSILIYPVINLSPKLAHKNSRNNLLGSQPTKKQIDFFSTDLQVNRLCPPVFLVHAADDSSVPVANSLRFYEACVKSKVLAEMHLYPKGGHGFGLENITTNDRWIERLFNWIDTL